MRSWDASVYAGLRKFHRAKGFDPDSQDVARHLGYPLYQVSPQELDHLTEVEHIPPSSKTFTFIMDVQLGLMLFLAVYWLHEHLSLTDLGSKWTWMKRIFDDYPGSSTLF
ncbi:hypothetical protein B0H16DRAFT_715739 [Mycena metata]|uniref:Uncharacterized protein n=1 Tax=Mycena metata TaxID=1033252 RepID=A0AAD7NDQ8_9AGAR|nr:hypothetical protein B0H16DRAFT_715739 [Mycena metata]